nr:unnamed protein product [Spirometra erinaceieuropaei]
MRLYKRSRDERIRTIIVPNNGFRFCADIMARAYVNICPTNVKKIFVITAYNQFVANTLMLSSSDCFITPYYKIPVDKHVNDELWKTGDCAYISRLDDEKQMGVEIQLPFITYVMEEF